MVLEVEFILPSQTGDGADAPHSMEYEYAQSYLRKANVSPP